jgi:hypothetical protein
MVCAQRAPAVGRRSLPRLGLRRRAVKRAEPLRPRDAYSSPASSSSDSASMLICDSAMSVRS